MMPMLDSSLKLFRYYKSLGEKAIDQLSEVQCFEKIYNDANSIGNIVKHLHGNMLSRWTDFLESDGEKSWRDRDGEFEDTINTKSELLEKWDAGWEVVLKTLSELGEQELDRKITIRGESHSIDDAILRQLAHYAYHVGQIVFIARNIIGDSWVSLSIPKGESKAYNQKNTGHIKDSGESIWEK